MSQMRRCVIYIFVLISLLIPFPAGAMPYFMHLGFREGLAHPSVMSVCQDSLGRIWFGTENGVSVYDGNRIVSCKPYESRGGTAFTGSVVKPIVCDSNGDVFFLAGSELVRHDAVTGSVSVVSGVEPSCLFVEDGYACVAQGHDVLRWNPGTASMEKTGTLPLDDVREVLVTSDGRRFLAGQDGLFTTGSDGIFKRLFSAGEVRGLFESSSGEVWAGSVADGLFRIRNDLSVVNYTVESDSGKGFISNNVRTVTEDPRGSIWFGTFNGLCRYDQVSGRFTTYAREDREGGLSQNSVHAAFVDRDGFLWVGTYYGGVNYADTKAGSYSFFPSTTSGEGLSHPVVGHVAEGPGALIWICTEGGGINSLDPSGGEIRRFPGQPFTNAKWFDTSPDGNTMYIATNRDGLFELDVRSGRFRREISPEDANSAYAVINVVARKDDDLYLSTDDGVLVHSLSSGRDSLLYPRTDGIRYVHEAISGDKLWLCSGNVVVFDLKSKTLVKEYPVMSDGARVRPMRVLPGPGDDVVISTFGHGLFRLENGEFRPFGPYMPGLSGYQVVRCEDGSLLVSGEDGIRLLDPSGTLLETYLPGRNLPLEALVMDSGLAVSSDGTVYAGGTNGLVSFRISAGGNPEPADLYFSDLYVDGTPIHPFDRPDILPKALPYSREVVLKGPQTRVDVQFSSRKNMTSLNWTDYVYSFDGDGEWHDVQSPMISLLNLKVGRHRISLGRRGAGVPLCSLDIRVKPFWYASWWAYLIYFLAASGIVLLLGRMLRLRRLASLAVEEERMEKARIQELNETKLRFFTTLSHELRTPLTLIIAQIDSIFQSYRLPPRVSHKMSRVMTQARQMNQLVTELIDFRKFEQNLVTLHVSKTAVNPFVSDILDRFKEISSGKDLHLGFNPSPGNPVCWFDAYQMQKVLMNLIFNAVKFTPEGGAITLSVRSGGNGDVDILVRDTGVGIAEKDLPHIFERFYQAEERDVARGVPGSGIGLALAKDIVERHHGRVTVESGLGEGTCFTVTLRGGISHFQGDGQAVIQDTPAPVPAEAPPAREDIPPQDDGRALVLIAEDDAEMASILAELFSVQYRVAAASDGEEALEMVRSLRPDLVVSDVMMPRMSGTELCAAIKDDQSLSHVPVVLLTALDGASTELGGLLKGADDYIAKPFNSKMLLARCNNLVKAGKMRGSTAAPQEKDISSKATNREDKEFLQRLQKIVREHISDPSLNNDVLASMMNMSRSRFYNRFKSVTSGTPNDYVMNMRLDMACTMLVDEPGLSVAEIADRLGFNTQNYFCHRFKDRFGVSPTQYRRGR